MARLLPLLLVTLYGGCATPTDCADQVEQPASASLVVVATSPAGTGPILDGTDLTMVLGFQGGFMITPTLSLHEAGAGPVCVPVSWSLTSGAVVIAAEEAVPTRFRPVSGRLETPPQAWLLTFDVETLDGAVAFLDVSSDLGARSVSVRRQVRLVRAP
jgi:hypothetical protein